MAAGVELKREQRRRFAEEGYLVVRQGVVGRAVRLARAEIARQLMERPLPAGHCGPEMRFLDPPLPKPLRSLFFDSFAGGAAEALIAPGKFAAPDHVQISLIVPPFPHRPGGPHVDGISPPEADGRPGTFTLLAGVFLTDQEDEDAGNLWVWPGSHRAAAAYLREHGPEALARSAPYPPVPLAEPRQVTGRVGDVLLAHYLLGHNIGGNTSDVTREVVYVRLRREGHRERWRDCVQDPFLEFEPVRGREFGEPGDHSGRA